MEKQAEIRAHTDNCMP